MAKSHIPNAIKMAQELGFQGADELYEYIHASKVNGQYKQARELYGKLTHHEKTACREHLKASMHNELYWDFIEHIVEQEY